MKIPYILKVSPLLFFFLPATTSADMSIVNTRHDLSATGPGEYKALTEERICVFCHTPHNATPFSPLWNKELKPMVYKLYESSTLSAVPGQPSGPSRLCLSCHDGTIALGEIVNPPAGAPTDGIHMTIDRLSSGRRTFLSTDISNDHPVSFNYYDALPNSEMADTVPFGMKTYGGGNIHCTTCHDPHDDSFGNFLIMSNNYSALCIACHNNKTGWGGSTHASATEVWDPPALEEELKSVAEYGCEACHTPHNAGGPKRLMRTLAEEGNCYPCHDGTVAEKDVKSEFNKISHHQVELTTIDVTGEFHDPAESVTFLQGHVECEDCHNSHAVNGIGAEAPLASGRQAGVSGKNTSGVAIAEVTNAYEVCFKCHGNSKNATPVILRWIDQNDTTLEFTTTNPSYHPVTAIGRNLDMPSLPSSYEPNLDVNSMIYCTDCHDSDQTSALGFNGPRGPHGSIYRPILRQRYEFNMEYQAESEAAYLLCYRCHDRNKLLDDLGNYSSFLHQKHVVDQRAPCAICHDPHGVQPLGDGDHSHLINFDRNLVGAYGANPTPIFNDLGTFRGSCALVCHTVQHDGSAQFTYQQ
ncbi:MAG: cytochrome c3 family protein [Desulfocapsa sp.]|nr:cytochrome c3 family protein [Desulfocapsa sp.]